MKNRLKKFMLSFLYNNAAKDLRFVSRLRAQWQAAEFIEDNMPTALYIPDRHKMFDFALRKSNDFGLRIECGVWKGSDVTYMANKYPECRFHGFDSFEGLPGNWTLNYPEKSFDMKGNVPAVPSNVRLVKGLIADTLPDFLKLNHSPISFVHLDFDMYRPTREFFEIAKDRIVPGTVILFDEFFGFPNWKSNEFAAWNESCICEWGHSASELNNVRFEYLAYGDAQVCVKIL